MIYLFLVFALLTAVGLCGAIAEGIFGDTPSRCRSQATIRVVFRDPEGGQVEDHTAPSPKAMTRVQEHFDGPRFDSIDYQCLVAGAEERIEELKRQPGSDL